MSLIKCIISGITDDRIYIRIVSMYISFFLTFTVSVAVSYLLLPEGILRGKHPFISLIRFSSDPFFMLLQIFGYNLIPSFLIIGANLIAQQSRVGKEKFLPVGYTVFFGLVVFFGIIAGTWSFELVTSPPPFGLRVLRLFDIVHYSGLLEFSGYLLLAVTSYRFTLWYSNRKRIIRSRSWKDIEVPAIEKVLFMFGFAILLIAALVESQGIVLLGE